MTAQLYTGSWYKYSDKVKGNPLSAESWAHSPHTSLYSLSAELIFFTNT